MPKNIYLPKENLTKIEIVQELKDEYKVPSFEEFMKDYKADENLNYDDLNNDSVGEIKGYGPCPDGCEKMSETVIQDRNGRVIYRCSGVVRFHLIIECFNWSGGGGTFSTDNTRGALRHAHELEDGYYSRVSNEVERKCATLIREAVRHYDRGNRVFGCIKVQGKF